MQLANSEAFPFFTPKYECENLWLLFHALTFAYFVLVPQFLDLCLLSPSSSMPFSFLLVPPCLDLCLFRWVRKISDSLASWWPSPSPFSPLACTAWSRPRASSASMPDPGTVHQHPPPAPCPLYSVLRIRDPVHFWPLDPGWVKSQNPDPDPGWTTRIIFPRAYKPFFGLKKNT